MKNEKTKVLVVYEDGREPLEAAAKRIKTSLADKAAVKTRRASEVAVAELLAADAYALGAGDPFAPEWPDHQRLFTGINLPGRKAGFLPEAKRSSAGLKAAFAPAELSVAGRDLVADQSDGTGAWAPAPIAAR